MKRKGVANAFVSLAAGAALTTCTLVAITGFQKGTPEGERIARSKGWHTTTYKNLRALGDKVDRGEKLSVQDWALVKKVIETYPDPELRMRAFVLLSQQKGTPFQSEAIKLAESLLTDENEFAVATALMTLKQLESPKWKPAAQKLLRHQSQIVRTRAKMLLTEA